MMKNHSLAILFLLIAPLLMFVTPRHTEAQLNRTYTITVSAGALDRSESIVNVYLPGNFDDGVYKLQDSAGEDVLLQVRDNQGHFLLNHLPAGESVHWQLDATPMQESEYPLYAGAETGEQTLMISSREGDVLRYNYQEIQAPSGINQRFNRSGYIHPVITPAGVEVTRNFNPDRAHQYAIWSAWFRMNFEGRETEFWNAELESGRVEADTLEQVWHGPVYGGFRARHQFIDYSVSEPIPILNEQWEVQVYPAGRERTWHTIDLHLVQTANTGSPVEVLEHVYGGISIRGHDDWDGAGRMQFDSSEGYNREEVVGEAVRWAHLSGEISGSHVGIALLGHPESSDFPHRVFMNQTEPFFSYGPLPGGNLIIEPGSPWSSSYRLIVHDGDLDREELERLWVDFAYPPAVSVSLD